MLGALLLGLVAGAIARAVVPNDAFSHLSGPVSWVVSLVLGLLGASLALLLVSRALFDFGGIIGAIVGSIVVVWGATFVIKRMN